MFKFRQASSSSAAVGSDSWLALSFPRDQRGGIGLILLNWEWRRLRQSQWLRLCFIQPFGSGDVSVGSSLGALNGS